MSFAAILIAPLALLQPAANVVEPVHGGGERTLVRAAQPKSQQNGLAIPALPILPAFDSADAIVFQAISRSFRARVENQVRIEQRVTIRITPRAAPMQPNMLMDMPSRPPAVPRLAERKMGHCLPASSIAGVQANAGNRLILFMRDQRVVSAALERACHARDFYSGFYIERSADGQICVNRDTLRSRSGANCKLSRIRQLVEAGN